MNHSIPLEIEGLDPLDYQMVLELIAGVYKMWHTHWQIVHIDTHIWIESLMQKLTRLGTQDHNRR